MKGAKVMLILLAIPMGMAFGGEDEPTDDAFWAKVAEAHTAMWRR